MHVGELSVVRTQGHHPSIDGHARRRGMAMKTHALRWAGSRTTQASVGAPGTSLGPSSAHGGHRPQVAFPPSATASETTAAMAPLFGATWVVEPAGSLRGYRWPAPAGAGPG